MDFPHTDFISAFIFVCKGAGILYGKGTGYPLFLLVPVLLGLGRGFNMEKKRKEKPTQRVCLSG